MPFAQRLLNEMYERCLDCLTAIFPNLPANSAGAEAAAGLRAAFTEIKNSGTAQTGFEDTAQVGTAQRRVARQNIRDYLAALARTATTFARKKPGFNLHYPAPHGKTDAELLADARAVAAKAVENKVSFTRLGLTDEFIESGDERVAAFEDAIDTTNEALSSRGAAVGGKEKAYEDAEDHFEELDSFIRNYYRDDPAKLSAWKSASHIERAAKKKKDQPIK